MDMIIETPKMSEILLEFMYPFPVYRTFCMTGGRSRLTPRSDWQNSSVSPTNFFSISRMILM